MDKEVAMGHVCSGCGLTASVNRRLEGVGDTSIRNGLGWENGSRAKEEQGQVRISDHPKPGHQECPNHKTTTHTAGAAGEHCGLSSTPWRKAFENGSSLKKRQIFKLMEIPNIMI